MGKCGEYTGVIGGFGIKIYLPSRRNITKFEAKLQVEMDKILSNPVLLDSILKAMAVGASVVKSNNSFEVVFQGGVKDSPLEIDFHYDSLCRDHDQITYSYLVGCIEI